MNGAPPKPMSGVRPSSSRRRSRMVSSTCPSASGSNVVRRSTSAADRTGLSIDGPSPLTKSNSRPIGSKGSSRSEKRIAASTSITSTGCSVTTHGELRRRGRSRAASDFSRSARYCGHVAAGLAHEPDRAFGRPARAGTRGGSRSFMRETTRRHWGTLRRALGIPPSGAQPSRRTARKPSCGQASAGLPDTSA